MELTSGCGAVTLGLFGARLLDRRLVFPRLLPLPRDDRVSMNSCSVRDTCSAGDGVRGAAGGGSFVD